MTIESEIIALSNYGNPITNERTQKLIEQQRENRREKHLKTLNDFEKWIESLEKDVLLNYKEIKNDIDNYFIINDKQLDDYFEKLNDDVLLKREKNIIQEINDIVKQCEVKKKNKVNNLDEKLEELEKERENNFIFFCNKLEFSLIEIAFMLEPQVKELVNIKRDEFQKSVKENRILNEEYVKNTEEQQLKALENFIQKRDQKILRWKQLKHDEALNIFNVEIQTMEYVNPNQRKELYQELKDRQVEIFKGKNEFLDKVNNIDMNALSKSYCEKQLEELQKYNNTAQLYFDQIFDKIMQESEENKQKCTQRVFQLQQRLNYIENLPENEIEVLLNEQINPIIIQLYENSRQQIKKSMQFQEEQDFKQNELVQNILKVFLKIGEKNDDSKKNMQKLNFEFELKKATAADENDEKLEKLNEEFEKIKFLLKQALHHPKLNELLEISFNKIDDIEKEYRDFHEKNIQIAKQQPILIQNLFLEYEKSILEYFELIPLSQKSQIETRNLQRAQEKALKIIQKQDKLKELEELKAQTDNANKKQAKKAPPAKKNDPKKGLSEAEVRLQNVIDQIGIEPVQFFKTPLNNEYIMGSSEEELAIKLYKIEGEDEKKQPTVQQIQQGSQIDLQISEEVIIPVDFKQNPPVDPEGNIILEKNVVVELQKVIEIVQNCKRKAFEYIQIVLDETQSQNKIKEKEFVTIIFKIYIYIFILKIEDSILNLDERLKIHYPLKGKVEVEIYQVRSAQISQHKKRYERFARSSIEKIDLQTEHFNFLMEQALEDMKEHEIQQKQYKDSLQTANKLAKLQGIQNHVKENSFQFGEKIRYLEEKLKSLANDEIEFMLQKNKTFIKESKLFSEGGEYAEDEVQWYQNMIKDIDQQLEKSRIKRNERIQEIIVHMNNKKKELIEQFEKTYAIAIEELAAKDGTGTKYGKPRRYVQERMRTEMNKCEKAQDAINENLCKLKELYEEYKQDENNIEKHIKEHTQVNKMNLFSNRVRRVLMVLRTIMKRYAIHINALKQNCPIIDIQRITYIENKFDIQITQQEYEKDKILQENELEEIGPLFFQKDNLKFSEWVQEIQKNTILEAQKIYQGEKAKFLTGTDKCPDYLRQYVQLNAIKAEEFRIQSCRNLRNSCEELSKFSPFISEMIFVSVKWRHQQFLNEEERKILEKFSIIKEQNENQKENHIKKLRPNLQNPQCKQELIQLVNEEKDRMKKYIEILNFYKNNLLDLRFKVSSDFFRALLNNFEFLLVYFDNEILFEDFNKLPGDDEIQKQHENIKVLYRIKQKGINIDTSSERSLNKVWVGFPIDSFNIDERKVEYKQTVVQEDEKGKKENKKGKNPPKKGNELEEANQTNNNQTKDIKSFKTYRQKSACLQRNKMFDEFKKNFCYQIEKIKQEFNELENIEYKFEFKWESIVKSLNNL
ncbi:hypothetical protein IMG5_196200 [Ichthyophthirius multifiliis]|uniref:Uncharacterized protein n=1 Tax=Ichthyophthirius multifiliis TaxID=5932 RepID=G0R535_ICHMU|nr:hypothetical protein IMG5_196200 [Ichthyophthirius multifiliis]EGR27437.1 hypothetical protein IMG5_196200 [Ichthyophthirius multifiliis]|eukprot:XP_004024347.1 hypothetical protein IMG5_196200 [Ichthyophthirius multifiliis]